MKYKTDQEIPGGGGRLELLQHGLVSENGAGEVEHPTNRREAAVHGRVKQVRHRNSMRFFSKEQCHTFVVGSVLLQGALFFPTPIRPACFSTIVTPYEWKKVP